MTKLLCLITLQLPFLLPGQLQQNFRIRPGKTAENLDVYSDLDEKTGTLNFFVLGKTNIHSFRLNKELKTEKTSTFDNTIKLIPHFDNYLGASKSNGTYHFFYTNNKYLNITYTSVDSLSFAAGDGQILSLDQDELIIDWFEKGHNMHLFTVIKNSAIFKLYVFSSPQEYFVKEFNFSSFDPKDQLCEQLISTRSKGRILNPARISDNMQVDASEAVKEIKCLQSGDYLHLLFDHQDFHSLILTISLQDFTHSAQKIEFSATSCQELLKSETEYDDEFAGGGVAPWFGSNSFIRNNQLFSLAFCKKNLLVEMIDLHTFERKELVNISPGSPMDFSSGPLLYFNGQRTKELKSTTQFFNKSIGKKAGISLHETEGIEILRLDAFASISGPIGGDWANYVNTSSSAFFYLLLDPKDYNKVTAPVPEDKDQFVIDYEKSMNVHTTDRFVQEHNGKVFHGCYLPGRSTYRVSLLDLENEHK